MSRIYSQGMAAFMSAAVLFAIPAEASKKKPVRHLHAISRSHAKKHLKAPSRPSGNTDESSPADKQANPGEPIIASNNVCIFNQTAGVEGLSSIVVALEGAKIILGQTKADVGVAEKDKQAKDGRQTWPLSLQRGAVAYVFAGDGGASPFVAIQADDKQPAPLVLDDANSGNALLGYFQNAAALQMLQAWRRGLIDECWRNMGRVEVTENGPVKFKALSPS